MVPRTVARVVNGTAPYPWPYDGRLHPSRLALVVVGQPWDDQEVHAALDRLARAVSGAGGLGVAVCHRLPKCSQPEGRSRTEGATALASQGGALRAASAHSRRLWKRDATPRGEMQVQPNATVLPGGGTTCAAGSSGLWSGVTDVVEAAGLDGFYGSRLDADLRAAGRDQLLVAGWGLETAVHSTLRSANDRGYECLLVADACAVVDPDCRAGAISTVLMSGGIFGAVGDTGAVCAALEPFLHPKGTP